LKETDLRSLKDGKYEIDGENVFAIVAKGQGRNKEEANLEIHRRYIDIQFIISGSDEMGWKPTNACISPIDEFDLQNDIQFFNDKPESWVLVNPDNFAIFFPEDAHLPLISEGLVHKVVVKVAVK
jgi:YhcH/YjgK/YiaL family protein